MNAPLRILHLEDSDLDAELVSETLAREGLKAEFLRVDREDAFVAALDDEALALILSDYNLPAFDGISALAIAHRKRPDLPFIFVSGVIEESVAIEALKSGATDYVFKSNLGRLGSVVRRALDEARSRKEQRDYEQALETLVGATSGVAGHEFFRALVRGLAEALHVRHAYVGILDPDAAHVRTVALWAGQDYGDNFEYALAGTPCSLVAGKIECVFACDVRRQFPNDEMLADMDIESYHGVPLFGSDSAPIGLLVVLDIRPMEHSAQLRQLLGIFASRAAVELERLEIVEQLRASNQRLEMLLQSSPLAIYTRDANGLITTWNPAAEGMFGWKASEVLSRPLPSVPDEQRAESDGLRMRLLAGEPFIRYEARRQKRDGSPIDIDAFLGPLRDLSGTITGIITVAADITERKRAEAEREQLAAIVESSNDAIVSRTLDGMVTSWNRGAERMFGYSAGEAIGRSITLLMPDGRPRRLAEIAERLRRGEEIAAHETERVAKDGRVISVLVSISPLKDNSGKISGASVIYHDISALKQAQAALHARETEIRIITDNVPALISYYDDKLLCRYANKPYVEFFGFGSQDIVGKPLREITGETVYSNIKDYFDVALHGTPVTYQRAHQLGNGETRHLEVRLVPDTTEQGTIRGCYALSNDITESLHAEAARKESERQFRQLADNIPEVFRISSADQHEFVYVSPAFEKIWGRPLEQLMANPRLWFDAVHPEDRERVTLAVARAAKGDYDEEYRVVRPDGSVRWVHDQAFPVTDESGSVYRIAGISQDITERREIESRLLHLAHHDQLTDLPNRALLHDRLVQALAQAKRNGWIAAAMFLGLDRFKMINETLGHGAGDELVREVSGRLVNAVRLGDTVGRFGGDEFVVILSHLRDIEDASLVANKILDALAQPFVLGDQEVFVTVSIGISLFPADSDEPAALLRNADAAMYRAKDMGRNNFQFYTAEMNARTHERLGLESSLRRAIERREFVLHYQPKASIRTGEITGVEALVRWNHPERGMVPPSEFIPLLEDTGLIVPVGEWVLQTACEQARKWQDAGLGPLRIAVNSSAREFQQRDFGAGLARIAREAGIDPTWLEIEITESLLMKNPEETAATLQQIKQRGVHISIDDFGTGYSSLSYLTRFPLSTVKIDRSFVTNITNDTGSASIARAVINLAHILGMKVIAEGVETEGQLGFLRANGCDEIQGYFLSKPLDADACTRLLSSGRNLQKLTEDKGAAEHSLLLVDDEANILSALTRLLQRDGYRILTAGNATEALELLAVNNIGVIISDQRMPGVSGVELLTRVRKLHPATMRMMLSGYADLKSVIEAINSGAVYKFLTKPWDGDQLRASVSEAFQLYDLLKARPTGSATSSDAGS